MIIGIDLDNTLWNLGEVIVKLYNAEYKASIDYNTIDDYWLEETFEKIVKNSSQCIDRLCHQACKLVACYENAVDSINKLKELGHVIYFVTSSTLKEAKVKDNTLKTLFYWYDSKYLVITHNKQLICLDVIIDDLYTHFSDKQQYHILYSQPYNIKYDINDLQQLLNLDIIRVYNWGEIFKYIQNLTKGKGDTNESH